jgi:hypothetical protein
VEQTRDFLDALAARGVHPRFVRVAMEHLVGDPLELASQLTALTARREVALTVETHAASTSPLWAKWAEAGVGKVDVPFLFDTLLAPAASGTARSPDQLEALCYGAVSDALGLLGLNGAGSKAMRFLAEHPGY